jgi:hypothetical protein
MKSTSQRTALRLAGCLTLGFLMFAASSGRPLRADINKYCGAGVYGCDPYYTSKCWRQDPLCEFSCAEITIVVYQTCVSGAGTCDNDQYLICATIKDYIGGDCNDAGTLCKGAFVQDRNHYVWGCSP